MEIYQHHVSGFFASRRDADAACSRLADSGLPPERLRRFETGANTGAKIKAGSDEVLKDMIVDGAIGSAVGTGLGALAQMALVAGSVSLLVASPLIAPLMMMGWGASLGGFIGAAIGAGEKKGTFSALVGDAVASGQIVLVAETLSAQETATVREVIRESVGNYNEVITA